MNEVDVRRLLDNVLEVEKFTKKGEIPKYRDGYVAAIEQRNSILVHADPNVFPEKLFRNRAPNQDLEQQKYIKDNYTNTTSQVFQDYLTVIGRAFIDSNWQVIPKEGSEDLMKYLLTDLPIYGSVETFVKGVLPSIKTKDANGLVAVMPHGFEYVESEDGESRVDDQKLFEPTIYYYASDKVIDYKSGHYALCVSSEMSRVEYNGKEHRMGRVMYLYTRETIWRIEQVGRQTENTYAIFEYFAHGEGILPVIELKGVPQISPDGSIYWVSPFYYAVGLLNLALTNRNYLQLSIANSAFPFRIMKASKCEFHDEVSNCQNGHLISIETGKDVGTCGACQGTGAYRPVSPMGTLLWTDSDRFSEGQASNYPLVEYVEPSTNAMSFVREQVDIDTKEARSILHLQTSTSDVKGSKDMTATGMAIDQQSMFSFVKGVSEQIFDVFDFANHRIAFQRYEDADLAPTLIYPQTFDFRTEADIWEQIKMARDSEAPAYIMHTLFYQLMNNLLSSDVDAQAVLSSIVIADKLFALSDTAIALRKATNSIEPWQITLHDSSIQIAQELIQEDPKFLELDNAERVAKLVERAKLNTFVPNSLLTNQILNA
jgi:hypothetical protein